MMAKHLILIHGRSSKPAQAEKARLAELALRHGLARVDPTLPSTIGTGVKLSFVYYGDVSNRLLLEHDPDRWRLELTALDPENGDAPCEPPGSYDKDLGEMLKQEDFSLSAYKDFLAKTRDRRGLDELARIASWIGSFTGLSDRIISRATPDMGAYLLTRKVGSEIRGRLQTVLSSALLAGDDICVVSHSMGCIVTYDVLWKLAQMSEYAEVQEAKNKLTRWATIGCPLGEPGVQELLYDSNERGEGRYPRNLIGHWINIAARDDFVSHDASVANDFREFAETDDIRIEDLPRIHTFWSGRDGANPHKLYGYLDNPTVAGSLADWIKSPGGGG